jgi:hypothetical protein
MLVVEMTVHRRRRRCRMSLRYNKYPIDSIYYLIIMEYNGI